MHLLRYWQMATLCCSFTACMFSFFCLTYTFLFANLIWTTNYSSCQWFWLTREMPIYVGQYIFSEVLPLTCSVICIFTFWYHLTIQGHAFNVLGWVWSIAIHFIYKALDVRLRPYFCLLFMPKLTTSSSLTTSKQVHIIF